MAIRGSIIPVPRITDAGTRPRLIYFEEDTEQFVSDLRIFISRGHLERPIPSDRDFSESHDSLVHDKIEYIMPIGCLTLIVAFNSRN